MALQVCHNPHLRYSWNLNDRLYLNEKYVMHETREWMHGWNENYCDCHGFYDMMKKNAKNVKNVKNMKNLKLLLNKLLQNQMKKKLLMKKMKNVLLNY